jgi:hypothetical protein
LAEEKVERLKNLEVLKKKGFLNIVHKEDKIWKVTRKTKKHLTTLKELFLMLAMFFLPFGYDALFKLIMDVTSSYWMADMVFYSISGCFFISYILLSKRLKNN